MHFSGRRRSSRLIDNPSLYKGPKKSPIYVDLVSEQDSDDSQSVNKDEMLECNDDIRNDGGRTESMEMKDYSDEENDFVMPGEVFSNSDGSSKKGGDKKSCSLRNKKEKSTRKLLLTSGKIKKRSLRKEVCVLY